MWNHRKRRLATSRAPPRHEGQVAMYYLATASAWCVHKGLQAQILPWESLIPSKMNMPAK